MRKKERGKEKNAINRGHYVLPATPKGNARTSLGPINNKSLPSKTSASPGSPMHQSGFS